MVLWLAVGRMAAHGSGNALETDQRPDLDPDVNMKSKISQSKTYLVLWLAVGRMAAHDSDDAPDCSCCLDLDPVVSMSSKNTWSKTGLFCSSLVVGWLRMAVAMHSIPPAASILTQMSALRARPARASHAWCCSSLLVGLVRMAVAMRWIPPAASILTRLSA